MASPFQDNCKAEGDSKFGKFRRRRVIDWAVDDNNFRILAGAYGQNEEEIFGDYRVIPVFDLLVTRDKRGR